MIHLIAALQFLTILPVGKPVPFDPQKLVGFFPLAGLFIGLLLFLADFLFLRLWPTSIASLLDVIFLALITAALHIDGLADTADGLFGHRSREKALVIMKDSRVGVMGLVCVICVLSLKWAGISGLDESRSLLIVLIPAYARGGILFGMKFLPYGRPDGGTGSFIFEKPLTPYVFIGFLFPVFMSLFIGWGAILLNATFFIIVSGLILFYRKRMGCITGDMLGAMVEITESILFLVFSAGSI